MLRRRHRGRVEAVQMTRELRENHQNWPEWLQDARRKPEDQLGALAVYDETLYDTTCDLAVTVHAGWFSTINWNDWIVNEGGYLSVCSPEVFVDMYEGV